MPHQTWCEVHRNDHWKIEELFSKYNRSPLSRSLKEIYEMCTKSKDNYCCERKPLLNVELDHIIVDELHSMPRVTGILTENLISECLEWNKEDDLDRKRGDPQGMRVTKLVQAKRSCAVSFDL